MRAFGAAIALVLIIEAIGPFANPRGTRKLWLEAAQLSDKTLRVIGATSMIAGLVLLTWMRNG